MTALHPGGVIGNDVAQKQLTTRDLQRMETRERVFQAALSEFQRVGAASAQIPKIVEEAGVAVGTFYRYFASKEDVLLELQRRQRAEVASEFAKRCTAETTLKELLFAFADCVLRERSERDRLLERESVALIVRREWPTPDWNDSLFGPLTSRFRDLQTAGKIRTHHSPEELTSFVSACVFGIVAGISVPSQERRQSARSLIELLLEGLEPRPPS